MRLTPLALVLTCLMAAPAHAQDILFGDDNSRWSNDGECDDPRFEGAGMTQTRLMAEDTKHDATDCRTAYEAGTIKMAGTAGTTPPAMAEADLIQDGINFGTDSGDWTRDGECDDRRFFGSGMAMSFSWQNVGKDATDCAAAAASGSIRLWDFAAAKSATQCDMIDFGDDNGPYPGDMECDDQRFEGPAVGNGLNMDNIGHDASDCRMHCTYGTLFLRDYP